MNKKFSRVALDERTLLFGIAETPLVRNGVSIGSGRVIPEIKFTLSPISIEASNTSAIEEQYAEMIDGVCRRAIELQHREIVVEFELLPQMTFEPWWGGHITSLLKKALDTYRADQGLNYLLRTTVVDIRETEKPPFRREGDAVKNMFESFRLCAEAGGDLLSIESIGGKEVTDIAIMESDIRGIIFGMGILGCADMEYLWGKILEIADQTGTIAAGDTACGIGNTAMVLADKNYIPRVFSAVVRAITAVRSLVAYEVGAVGPGKDCGYENIYIKAVTGYPMSLEGKSAACAHLSSLGNIASAYPDLWSNESVQNIKLLSGMAPVVSMEQLIYDCRLMNVALGHGKGLELRDWLVESDASLDPQAYILKPDVVQKIAKAMVTSSDHYQRSIDVARTAVQCLEEGIDGQKVAVSAREKKWLTRIHEVLDELPTDRERFIAEEKERWREQVLFAQYQI